MELRPRESVIFADNLKRMVTWYQEVLGFKVDRMFDEDYAYCNLENSHGIQIGIADAKQMGIEPGDRKNNSIVLQFEVADVPAFLEHLQEVGGTVAFGPSFDKKSGFWYGGFHDIEGNPFWVVDENCP